MDLDSSKASAHNESEESQPLIPGLPDEIAEKCLLYLPYPHQSLVRSVSSSWNRAINDPIFLLSRKALSLPLPYILVLSSNRQTLKLQWQALDPSSKRWFVLPPMPTSGSISPSSISCTSLQGSLYVLGGMESSQSSSKTPIKSLLRYSTSTNKWTELAPMKTPRAFFVSQTVGSRIYAAGGICAGHGDTITATESYDPSTDTWRGVASMRSELSRYDAAVIGPRMYVTEGWTWPFSFSPRGAVFHAETDTWEEMSLGMREGWTGIGVVLGERLFVISEHGDCPVKFYVGENEDAWRFVGGSRFPSEAVQRPFCVSAVEGRIYVVGCRLNVVVGRVSEEGKGEVRVDWELVEGPKAFESCIPFSSQVVYG